MSSTRSPSQPEPAINAPVIIVSHGSPSDPEPQEAFIHELADRVAASSGRIVRGATLARDGSLERALHGLDAPVIFPHFMSDGWFVSTNLQERLGKAGLTGWQMVTPLGLDKALPDLAVRKLQEVLSQHELTASETTLVIAAHGSPSDPRPARATQAFAEVLTASDLFGSTRVGFVDEDPSLEEAATVSGPAIVLPFFAASAGHVLMDLPEALETAKFDGVVTEPIGTWDEIPQLIAMSMHVTGEVDAA